MPAVVLNKQQPSCNAVCRPDDHQRPQTDKILCVPISHSTRLVDSIMFPLCLHREPQSTCFSWSLSSLTVQDVTYQKASGRGGTLHSPTRHWRVEPLFGDLELLQRLPLKANCIQFTVKLLYLLQLPTNATPVMTDHGKHAKIVYVCSMWLHWHCACNTQFHLFWSPATSAGHQSQHSLHLP